VEDGVEVLGIDIGGSGIKAAVVDTELGKPLTDRVRVRTPHPSTPEAVVTAAAGLVASIGPGAPAGVGFPAVVRDGVTMTAANVHKSWIGAPARELFEQALGRQVVVANDADVAGLAEMRHGAGRGHDGTVLGLTLGTGIGSALFVDGRLVPNTELGHLEIDGRDAEQAAAPSARDREGLSWRRWAKRLGRYIDRVDALLWPDLVILGGGVSQRPERWIEDLGCRPEIVTAELANEAGIIGAALLAAEQLGRTHRA
jgi:polyphosphate glucokinase